MKKGPKAKRKTRITPRPTAARGKMRHGHAKASQARRQGKRDSR